MAEFKGAALTAKGIALLAKAQAEKKTIEITKAVAGNGTYMDGEDLQAMTGLKCLKQEFAPSSVKRQNETNVFVRFTISNFTGEGSGLTHGYYVTEIGLMANDPDEGEILYALAVGEEGKCDYLQAYNNLLPATIGVEFLIEVGNADQVTLTTDLSAYATVKDLGGKADEISFNEETGEVFLKANGKEISGVKIQKASIAMKTDVEQMAEALMGQAALTESPQ